MDLYILNKQFRRTAYVEAYNSAIWSLRYAEYGDFEIHVPYFSDLTSYLMSAAYVYDKTTETAMFVEDVEIDSTVEDGSMVIFKGRSLESILTRRIIWRKKTVSGKIQDIIQGLLNENIISPTETDRQIPNFIFQSNSDTRLNDYVIDEHSPIELHGDILYDIVKYLCDLYDVGFKITLNSLNQFVFQLYCGKILDGSDEDNRRTVLFSPKMDNLSNTRYYQSSQNYKNVTRIESTYELKAEQNNPDGDTSASTTITAATPSWMVFPPADGRFMVQFHKKVSSGATLNVNGTGAKPLYYQKNDSWLPIAADVIDGSDTRIVVYDSTGNGRYLLQPKDESEDANNSVEQTRVVVLPEEDRPTGLDRREIYTDAGSIETEDGMTSNDYANSMKLQGYTTLRENRRETEVDGESIPDVNYIYGMDYALGDIVKVENECGITVSSRIIEYVQTDDENGPSACPTFSSVYS